MNNRLTFVALIIIAIGILTFSAVTLFFHAYTYATENVYHATTDALVTAEGDALGFGPGGWRDYEWTIYLGTQRIVAGIGAGLVGLGLVVFLAGRVKDLRGRDIMAVITVLLGTLAVIGFLTIFYPCFDMMLPARMRPMRCVWTMRVLFGVAASITAGGFFMLLFGRSKELVKGLNIGLITQGVAFILIPRTLTGFCLVHRCVDGFAPFSLVIGIVMLLVFVINVFVLRKKEDDDYEASDNL